MRVCGLVSGGKDSCFNLMKCVENGHDIVCLANLQPPEGEDEIDSYMYQSVGHDALELYQRAMQLPLYRRRISGKAVNIAQEYQPDATDEVEDLYRLLTEIMENESIEAVSVGAIFSDYQRVRVENVCKRLGLKMLGYLWHRDQEELMLEMIEAGVDAIIIKVAAMGLDPEKHLGLTLKEIFPHMKVMNSKYGLNICGEGGEFESFVVDCPLFKETIVLEESEMVYHSRDAFAPVAYLKLKRLRLEAKNP